MNVLVTLDSNYVTVLTVMLRSLVESNPDKHINLYVIHSTLTEYDLGRISLVSSNITVKAIRIDDELFKGAHFTKRISKETYYRLLMCEYLPEDVDRILYLDPDIVVIKPLDELYNIDFGDNIFAAAGHVYGVIERFNIRRLKMARSARYINAGVMMVNLNAMRKAVTSKMIFDYVDKMNVRLFQADQDVINGLFSDRIICLNEDIYNLDERTFRHHRLSMKDVIASTVIIHYDGKNKPWHDNYNGKLQSFYAYFENKKSKDCSKNEIQAIISA